MLHLLPLDLAVADLRKFDLAHLCILRLLAAVALNGALNRLFTHAFSISYRVVIVRGPGPKVLQRIHGARGYKITSSIASLRTGRQHAIPPSRFLGLV